MHMFLRNTLFCYFLSQKVAYKTLGLGHSFVDTHARPSNLNTVAGRRFIFNLECLISGRCLLTLYLSITNLKPFFLFRLGFLLFCCTLWSPSVRFQTGFWLGWINPGCLENLGLCDRKCRAWCCLSLIQVVKTDFLYSLLFLEGVSPLWQSQLPHHHHLLGVVVAAAVLWRGAGAVKIVTSSSCIPVASLPSYVQPLPAMFSDTDKPSGGVPLHILQPLLLRQRYLHGVSACAVGFLVSMVTTCRLLSC